MYGYPTYQPLLPYMFGSPIYQCSPYSLDVTQSSNMAQIQQCICELQTQCMAVPIPRIQAESEDVTRALDRIIFPEDPIREYIAAEIEKVRKKYNRILREIETLEMARGIF